MSELTEFGIKLSGCSMALMLGIFFMGMIVDTQDGWSRWDDWIMCALIPPALLLPLGLMLAVIGL